MFPTLAPCFDQFGENAEADLLRSRIGKVPRTLYESGQNHFDVGESFKNASVQLLFTERVEMNRGFTIICRSSLYQMAFQNRRVRVPCPRITLATPFVTRACKNWKYVRRMVFASSSFLDAASPVWRDNSSNTARTTSMNTSRRKGSMTFCEKTKELLSNKSARGMAVELRHGLGLI